MRGLNFSAILDGGALARILTMILFGNDSILRRAMRVSSDEEILVAESLAVDFEEIGDTVKFFPGIGFCPACEIKKERFYQGLGFHSMVLAVE